jgi:hypothetical protein
VLGAASLLDDAYLDKEDNSRISDFIFKWLRPVSASGQGGGTNIPAPHHLHSIEC